MFELGDFSLVALRPVSARLVSTRLVGGFGRACSQVGDPLAEWLCR